jgi:predicted O-linked N-acetylglucosamine transferase (SPINDLY family)
VVSLCGGSFASRVAASLLYDLGIPELACNRASDYYEKALQMARDKTVRNAYKSKLNITLQSLSWPPTTKQQSNALAYLLSQV